MKKRAIVSKKIDITLPSGGVSSVSRIAFLTVYTWGFTGLVREFAAMWHKHCFRLMLAECIHVMFAIVFVEGAGEPCSLELHDNTIDIGNETALVPPDITSRTTL